MDIIFECPQCKTELSIDAAGAGSEIDCPTCSKKVLVPEASAATPPPPPTAESTAIAAAASVLAPSAASHPPTPPPTPGAGKVINAMLTSAAAKEFKHFVVPVHEGPTESLITKPLPTLDVAAKETDRQMRVKSFRHSDHVEVGKDHFDEHICQWLGKVGESSIISITPFTYTHQDLASRAWITDYGLVIVYRG